MNIEAFCDALAERVSLALADVEIVYPTPTVNVQSNSVTVSPAPEWGNWGEGTSFCDPELSFELILVASTSDFRLAMSWFMARVAELRTAFDDDPYIDSTCDGLSIAGWGQPQIVSTGTGDALAVRVRLNPVVLN